MNPHVSELLPAYHDGELTSNCQRQVEKHLQDCPTCRAELKALEELSSLLKADFVPIRLPRSVSPRRCSCDYPAYRCHVLVNEKASLLVGCWGFRSR